MFHNDIIGNLVAKIHKKLQLSTIYIAFSK
nr:MAG TPA: hypothetical protein [Caudoviricetes sp.]